MSNLSPDLPAAEVFVEIPFHDVDLMGVAWHGHYAKYCEIARCALLDKFSYNYKEMKESGYAWPVIELKLRYAHPARLGQKIRIKAMLREYELHLKIDYLIADAETDERLSKGHTIQVPVDMRTQKMLFGAPPILYEKLGIGT
ncbi:MAG: acyl-CoA thioesterase [Alphaproteobacteria bacterium]|nr:acyl-CoA thioesterase [Alphaproteobacteria bacterium]